MTREATLTFYAFTREEVKDDGRALLFDDAAKIRRFRITYDLAEDAITIDERIHDVRAPEGERIETVRWVPFLRRHKQDGGHGVRVPLGPARQPEFHVHRAVSKQVPRATATDGALDPGWQSIKVDRVNLRIHWPSERGAARTRYVGFRELRVGADVTIFSRTYHIHDCDAPTRRFFEVQGVRVPPAEPVPEDAYVARQEALLERAQHARREFLSAKLEEQLGGTDPAFHRADPFRQTRVTFGDGERRQSARAAWPAHRSESTARSADATQGAEVGSVRLRFWLRSDGASHAAAGARLRKYLLRYHVHGSGSAARPDAPAAAVPRAAPPVLGLELVELEDEAHARGDGGVLLRAGRDWAEQSAMTAGGPQPNAPPLRALRVGARVWLNGERLLVLGCDERARALLNELAAQGGEEAVPPNLPFDHSPHGPAPRQEVSDANVAPGRRGFDPVVRPAPPVGRGVPAAGGPPALHFTACVHEPSRPEFDHFHRTRPETERRFALTLDPDRGVSVSELAPANAGRKPGLVVRREPPGVPVAHGYGHADFSLGAVIALGGYRFLLTDATEQTLAWQEAHPHVYPQADAQRVIRERGAEVVRCVRDARLLEAGGGARFARLGLEAFIGALHSARASPHTPLAGLTLHEAVTLFRAFQDAPPPGAAAARAEARVDLNVVIRALELAADMGARAPARPHAATPRASATRTLTPDELTIHTRRLWVGSATRGHSAHAAV